ncbi:MAG: hypothetical protein ABSA46_21355 [Thermodesulfovibrionales bacterium]|jgi:hypothetical protein
MHIKNRTRLVTFLAILLSASALAFMTTDERYVAAPGFASVVVVLLLWIRLWARDKKIPFFDAGMFCALATLVYTVYPLLNYWADGLQFGVLSDNRLQQYRISPEELGFFHLRHVLYLFSFVVVYSQFRGRGTIEAGNVRNPDSYARIVIVSSFLLLTGYFFLLQLVTGFNYNTSYEPEAFANNVAFFSRMPLFLSQISYKLGGILFFFKLALLFIVVSRCRQRRWLIILLVWVTAEIIQAVYIKGARTSLVLFPMATALLYHRLIKPLSFKFLIISGTLLLTLFNVLGLYRSYFDISDMRVDLSRSEAGIFSGTNEFQSLLGTEYNVLQLKEGGVDLPWYLYINDFITILPPQQLMSFEKVSASEWYLRQIGLSKTGIGFMWGVISQSIIGLDWFELPLRGAILGYILARFHRWYLKRQSGFMETLLYIFLCLKVYYTFRDTTFSLLSNFVWEVIPFYLIMRFSNVLESRFSRGSRYRSIPLPNRSLK